MDSPYKETVVCGFGSSLAISQNNLWVEQAVGLPLIWDYNTIMWILLSYEYTIVAHLYP